MRIAENRTREQIRIAGNPVIKIAGLGILFIFIFAAVPANVNAESSVNVRLTFDPPTAGPITDELTDILTDTLTNVLFESDESADFLGLDAVEVAEGIKTGINVVIEPKGFTVGELTLDFDTEPAVADVLVHPVGWSPDNPKVTESVIVQLDESQFGQFWHDRLSRKLQDNNQLIMEMYGTCLIGLPLIVSDRNWISGLVMPALEQSDPAQSIFEGFAVTRTVDFSKPEVVVTIHLEAKTDIIELIRPRMYSQTLYNVVLDRFRERVNSKAGIIVGMPRNEVENSLEELSEYIQNAIEADDLARRFDAYTSVTLVIIPMEPVVRIDVIVESRLYDLHLETLIDFGNETSDSTEVQARFGFLAFRGLEAFVNFNLFTNDFTLESDVAIGIRPTRGTFAAVGYDLEREAVKYFVEQEFTPGFILRGEIFEDDSLNEFGLSYQLQQYMSAGLFTNGNNEYWVRGIFTL
ncbi:MAG: hypothetical protein NTY09_07945 [bacterium]|nr:hypothetical protein [bacterium]